MIKTQTMFALKLALAFALAGSSTIAVESAYAACNGEAPVCVGLVELEDCDLEENLTYNEAMVLSVLEEEDEKDKDKKGSKDKDTLVLGIGPELVDTSDRTVMVDDTLIYEDYEIYQPNATDTKFAQNEPYDSDKRIMACGSKVQIQVPHQVRYTEMHIIETPEELSTTSSANLFPNPATASDAAQVITGTTAPASIFVYDMSGKMVQTIDQVTEKAELRRYTTGSYIVLIRYEDGSSVHKKLLVR